MSLATCTYKCTTLGYKYLSLNDFTCWCTRDLFGISIPASECNRNCALCPAEKCGNVHNHVVYDIQAGKCASNKISQDFGIIFG